MGLGIRLARLNSEGISASLESSDLDYIVVAERKKTKNAKLICSLAAARLRELADRFDALAKEEVPLNGVVQNRINKGGK